MKRVLARHFLVDGWPGRSAVLKALWGLSESVTPPTRAGGFNQAMMDLGATVCTRRNPDCANCPLAETCQAHAAGNPHDYPGRRPRKRLPERSVQMLLVRDPAGSILLERRPPSGIWGGLWCLPEVAPHQDPVVWCRDRLQRSGEIVRELDARRHTFSHFHLDIAPVEILLKGPGCAVLEAGRQLWYNPQRPENVGLAAPVTRLLAELTEQSNTGDKHG